MPSPSPDKPRFRMGEAMRWRQRAPVPGRCSRAVPLLQPLSSPPWMDWTPSFLGPSLLTPQVASQRRGVDGDPLL